MYMDGVKRRSDEVHGKWPELVGATGEMFQITCIS